LVSERFVKIFSVVGAVRSGEAVEPFPFVKFGL